MALAVDQFLALILQANNTGVLCLLRETQTNTETQPFQQLILDLTTALNSQNWLKQLLHHEKRLKQRQKKMTIEDVHRCSDRVLTYITTLIDGKQVATTLSIWTQIFRSSLAKQISFYRFLFRENVLIPESILAQYFKLPVPSDESVIFQDLGKLLFLGFPLPITEQFKLSVGKCERLFSVLNQPNSYPRKVQAAQMIDAMTTPAHMSLFLSYFRDYDVNTVSLQRGETVLERVLYMDPPSPERVLNLVKSLVLRRARLSKSLGNDRAPAYLVGNPFLLTRIGTYAVIGLRADDLYPCRCPEERDMELIDGILKYIETLPLRLRQCFLDRLRLSYSIMHRPTISLPQEARECVARPLSLKDWCRLKIKDACPQRDVDQLKLCQLLKEYVTFGLLNPNYASNCIAELNAQTSLL